MPLRALLIAVDQYHPDSNVRPLAGCLNDVSAVRKFLLDHYSDQLPDPEKQIRILRNEQATRAGVIDAFRDHLGLAGPDDTVLIYFSGHGAQNITAAEFQPFVPDDKEEGWVLYDSRLPGHFDLADKEIALLLEAIGQGQPAVVLISDSCHSGSVTRGSEDFAGWKPRFIPGSKEPRPLDSYLNGEYRKRLDQQNMLSIPATRHIVFSACDNKEVAWESDEKCGVFTRALLDILAENGGSIRYADVYTRVCASIRTYTRQQNPQADALGGFNPRDGFLGKPVPAGLQRRYSVYFDEKSQAWRIHMGAAHGLRTDTDEVIAVRLFDAPSDGNDLGAGNLTFVGVTESGLDTTGNTAVNPYKTYWGEPQSMPQTPFQVYCPDRAAVAPLEAVLALQPEGSILLSDRPEGCAVELRFENGNFVLCRTGHTAWFHGVEGRSEAAVGYLLETLDHLAHWYRIQDLRNPRTGIPARNIVLDLRVQQNDDWVPLPGESVALSIRGQQVNFRLDTANYTSRPLFMALVYLNPRFGMSVLWHSTSAVPAGKSGLRILEDCFYLPPEMDEELDTLHLIASTEPIQQTAFSRPDLPVRIVPAGGITKGGFRSIGGLSRPDWTVRTLRIRLLRDRSDGAVGAQPVKLAGGQVTLGAHPAFRSTFALTGPAATRGLDAVQLDQGFFKNNPQVEMLSLAATKGAEAQFLDLTGITAAEQLAQQPLEIILNPEDPDSVILPFWFDGENFLPLGEPAVQPDGSLQVRVHHIPEDTPGVPTRSLGKALRLFCFKFAKDYGLPLNTQFLHRVQFSPQGKPVRSTEGVAAAVAKARQIVLLIHGIIGDTGYMAEAFRAFAAQDDALVLTFDYENLNTPLESTALALKNLLLKAGIRSDDGKELTVVAQSMGGLVARYLIEHLDGRQFVDRLILTGTPNAGSRLGNTADYVHWVSVMLGLGLRYFSWSLPGLAGLLGALQFAKEKLFVTLEQLKPDSELLRILAAGAGTTPPLPYRIIAGDIGAFLSQENDPDFMVRVLAQTGRLFYGDTRNDGAVSVESICSVEGAETQVLPGHHYGYYREEFRVEG